MTVKYLRKLEQNKVRRFIIIILAVLCCCFEAGAQFKSNRLGTGESTTSISSPPGSGTQNTKSDDVNTVQTDTLAGFSLKRIIRGFAGRDTLTPGDFFTGSVFVPGAGQIYNRDYWKLPVVYGGIGAGVYYGITSNQKYKQTGESRYKTISTLSYIGAGLVYWGSLLDGAVCFKTDYRAPVPAKAAIYSALLPGLGQAYNGDYWKIPIWVGGFTACGYFLHINDIEYKRFRYIYLTATDADSGYYGGITASQAQTYKDLYRRYRDYSILALLAVYALNIIDANVFAYMADFDISDNLASLSVEPAVIEPIYPNLASTANPGPAVGVKMNFNF